MGILRIGRDLGRYSEVIGAADRLLASPEVHDAEIAEIRFARAYALAAVDRGEEAVVDWAALASNPDDINGAKSAYYLGQYYYDKGNLKKSRQVVEALIDANTPHQYWLARAFILLSDVNRKEGKTFEADEYLKSLKESYPGNETDIFIMIDQRLK
jgi:TolA-binding protein